MRLLFFIFAKINLLMKSIFYLLFLSFVFVACNSVKVVNVKYANKIPKNYLLYSLPQNVVEINIELTEINTIKGPYFEFAEKYLGIKNVAKKNNVEYFISNSNLSVFAQPDSSNMYFVIQSCKNKINSFSLTNTGILTSINYDKNEVVNKEISKNLTQNFSPFQSEMFTEISQKDFIKEKIDTIWKQIKVDTNFVRVPMQKKTIDSLSFEDKAKEAAHHVLRIRKRLFKLLSGAYEKVPVMNSVSDVIKELKSEEEEYLSLFIGKTYTRKLNYRYYYTPNINDVGKRVQIANFNSNKGILEQSAKNNEQLILEINNNGSISKLDTAFSKFSRASNKKGIAYRVPELVTFSLFVGENLLLENQIQIAQFGVLCNLPVNYINKKHFVEFNPNYGNIIRTGCK